MPRVVPEAVGTRPKQPGRSLRRRTDKSGRLRVYAATSGVRISICTDLYSKTAANMLEAADISALHCDKLKPPKGTHRESNNDP